MLHYDAGAVDVIVKQSDASIATHVPLLTGVLLGDRSGSHSATTATAA